jgi:hypothetical protein
MRDGRSTIQIQQKTIAGKPFGIEDFCSHVAAALVQQ